MQMTQRSRQQRLYGALITNNMKDGGINTFFQDNMTKEKNLEKTINIDRHE